MLTLNKASAENLFRNFSDIKALIIGDIMLDSYIWGKVERISPEAPVPVVSVTKRENRLGGAANVALNIYSLGAKPIICSVTGNDNKGQELCQLFEQNNITTTGIIKSNNRITTTKFRIIGNNYQMLRVDEEMSKPLLPEENTDLCNHIEHLLLTEKPQVIIFEDYDKGVITPKLIEFVTETAEKLKIPIAVDPKKKNFMFYKNVTLFKPNYKELCEGLKIENTSRQPDQLLKICSLFQQQQNIKHVLLTLSEQGIFVSTAKDNNDYYGDIIPARVRNISDVSGAGDTVISIAALCIALHLPIYDTAFIANIGGGQVCEYAGVVPVDKEKLFTELLSYIS